MRRRARRAGHRLHLRLEHPAHRPGAVAEGTESYKEFPPLQAPASYNLDQVIEQVKEQIEEAIGANGD